MILTDSDMINQVKYLNNNGVSIQCLFRLLNEPLWLALSNHPERHVPQTPINVQRDLHPELSPHLPVFSPLFAGLVGVSKGGTKDPLTHWGENRQYGNIVSLLSHPPR